EHHGKVRSRPASAVPRPGTGLGGVEQANRLTFLVLLGRILAIPELGLGVGPREDAVLSRLELGTLGCGDARATRRHGRHRGGVTFSLHRLLRAGSDDAVCLEAVLLLPGLDLGDRPGADLSIDLGADDLLHPGVVQPATVRVAVASDIDEVPRLAVLAAFRPGPAPGGPVALEDLLDRSGVDVDREAGAVVGHARRGRIGALDLPPDLPLVPAVRLVPLRAPVRDPVPVEEDLLPFFESPEGIVEPEVGIRFRNRERREV